MTRSGRNVALLLALALTRLASAKTVLTVPAVASIRGLNDNLFRSDLWLFNRSYASEATATLTYRAFGGGGHVAEVTVNLNARQSVLLEDVVGTFLGMPGTAGALEVAYATGSGPVSATSRVFTVSPSGTFGTSVTGLPSTASSTRAVFVGLGASADLSWGFRSNAGAYNPNLEPATVTFSVYGENGAALGSTSQVLAGLEATQLYPNIFALVGAGSVETRNAFLVVTSTAPVFSYVTVIDNVSGDSVFLSPDQDESEGIAGAWEGTFTWAHYTPSGCSTGIGVPAQATFGRDGSFVTGTMTTSSDPCGIGSLAFIGTLEGDTLGGIATDDDGFELRARGTLTGPTLEITIDNGGGYVIGQLQLHR